MHERIQFISHQKSQVLLVDFSRCSAVDVEKIARAVPETVTAQPRASVLLLADFTGASFNDEALRAMKESAVFNKPYIKKSAWVGTENLFSLRAEPKSVLQARISNFQNPSRRLEVAGGRLSDMRSSMDEGCGYQERADTRESSWFPGNGNAPV